MTLERPLWLLAILAVPILYLLARNLRERRAVPVSSLLIWRLVWQSFRAKRHI